MPSQPRESSSAAAHYCLGDGVCTNPRCPDHGLDILDVLDCVTPVEKVTISRGSHDFLVSLYTLGQIKVLANAPYRHYAQAIGLALSRGLRCPLEVNV